MNVLIADKDKIALQILKGTLASWNHTVEISSDGLQAFERLQEHNAPRIAILDWTLPGMDGIDICRKLRESGEGAYTYIILLTDRSRKEDIAFGLEAGADDYIVKPFHAVELRARLRAGQRITNLHSALLNAQEDLRRQATTDPLTELDNRASLSKSLEREIKRARRQKTNIAIMMLDLDHFKKINDTYGHLVGDKALRDVAHTLRQRVRDYEIIGRYGGEEFMIVLTNIDQSTAEMVAERFRRRVANIKIELTDGTVVRVTASVGLVVSLPGAPNNAESLIHAADQALYKAKRKGRNQVYTASTESIKHTISPVPAITIASTLC